MPEWVRQLRLEAPHYLWLLLLLLPLLLAGGRRTFSRGRPRLAALARFLLLLAVVLAAAGLTIRLPADRLGVVFVLDRSASMAEEARAAALAFVQRAADTMGQGDKAAVVVVGDGAMVEREPTAALDLESVASQVSPHRTDLAAGLRLAEALMPSDTTRRVVVLSDGEETAGDVITQAASAEPDVELWTVPFARAAADEVLLEGIAAPDQVSEGGAFELRVVARASRRTEGRLHLYRGEALLGTLPVTLTGGRSDLFVLRQDADVPGILRYRAVLETSPEDDSVPQNNVAVTTVSVEGRPRVLYAEGKPGQARHLRTVLEAEGLRVEVVGPGEIPGSLAALQPYAAVLLSDVPAYAMTDRQMQVLKRYVEDLGRGLAMFGGDESFGVGGYYRTPVEEVLPVRMDIQDKRFFPSQSMVLAMDKSGSMGGTGVAEKLGMAKEAAIQTAELLSDRDRLGVVTFDAAASWAVPMSPLSRRREVIREIAKMRSGGGTDVYVGLKEAYKAQFAENTAQKHIILLSDGITFGADFETMIKAGARRDVTLSAIAIGSDSDAASMDRWAQWGGGRGYLVTRPEHIPRIFTRETMLASRNFLVEEPFVPAYGAPDPVTKGLPDPLPVLAGFVATEAKGRARTALWANREENTPLLATWRVGLGRSAAWTSDVKARWAGAWLGTEAYTRLFTQLVRWVAAAEGAADVQAAAELERGVLTVTVDAYDADGGFRNFLEGEARFIAPDLSVRTQPLQQTAPGRYTAAAPVEADGSHLVGVFLRDAEGNAVGQAVAEAAQAYSPEYRPSGGGDALLAEVARVGRGRVLRPEDAAGVFAAPPEPRLVPHPLWPPLVVLAALLLLLDAAIRRLEWPLWGPRTPPPVVAGGIAAGVPRAAPPRRPARLRPAAARAASPGPVEAQEPASPAEVPASEPSESSAPSTASERYVGGLLAARNRARNRGQESDE